MPRRLAEEGLFHPEPIRAAWQAHLEGHRNLQYQLWSVLMFQAWNDGATRRPRDDPTAPDGRRIREGTDMAGSTTPKLLYLVSEDWYFVSHRLPLAVAAKEAGYDVAVATRVAHHGDDDPGRRPEPHPDHARALGPQSRARAAHAVGARTRSLRARRPTSCTTSP